jgi:hypothetical protein
MKREAGVGCERPDPSPHERARAGRDTMLPMVIVPPYCNANDAKECSETMSIPSVSNDVRFTDVFTYMSNGRRA